jgi:hypothetical protein
MIPTIGVMVGAYIFVKLLSLATRSGDRRESFLVIVFSIMAMILTLFCVASLLTSGLGRSFDSILANNSEPTPNNAAAADGRSQRSNPDVGRPGDREIYIKLRSEAAKSLGLTLRADGDVLQAIARDPIPTAQMRDDASKFARDAAAVVAGFRTVRITDSIGNSWTEHITGPTGKPDYVAPFPRATPRS